MNVDTCSRNDLEAAILENDILPCDTSEQCAAVSAKSTDELRAIVSAWVAAGDECAGA